MINLLEPRRRLAITFLACALCPALSARTGAAQAPPATDVFLAPLTIAGATVTVGAPVNISANPGYDNQPSFLPDSSGVLFASNRDGKQNDIYRWDIAKHALVQLTRTDENEYSPLVSPDGKSFVCVHGAEQSLFRYDLDGSHPRLAYQHGTALIGYHVWITDTEIAAFILGVGGSPATLQVIDTTTGQARTMASNPGRSLLKRPGTNAVSFVAKRPAPQVTTIEQFDVTTHEISVIARDTLKSSEDLTWLPDGKRLLMGEGQTLSMWDGAVWREIANLASAGVSKITRLSVSPDGRWLAIVGEPVK